jgi:hypothetical protein
MSEDKFATWLLGQRFRNDPVGDVARDFSLAGVGETTDQVRRHMVSLGATPAAMRALSQAVKEWDTL